MIFFLQQTEHKWSPTNNFIPYPCLDNKLRLAPFYDKFHERKWINLALEFLNSINPRWEICLSWGYQGNSICKKQDIARCSQFCMLRQFIVHFINKQTKKVIESFILTSWSTDSYLVDLDHLPAKQIKQWFKISVLV